MARKKRSPTKSHESSTTGRVAELFLGSVLLSNGFEVYQPVVDVAIDYLAYNQARNLLKIQCKSRSQPFDTVFDLYLPKDERAGAPTHVFYMRGPADDAEYWLVPWSVVKRLATKTKNKRGRAGYRIYLTEKTKLALRNFRGEYGITEANSWKS